MVLKEERAVSPFFWSTHIFASLVQALSFSTIYEVDSKTLHSVPLHLSGHPDGPTYSETSSLPLKFLIDSSFSIQFQFCAKKQFLIQTRLPAKQGFSRHILINHPVVPVFQFLFVFPHSQLSEKAHNLKLNIMKTTSQNKSKTSSKWQEFVEYLESIYFPDALESMTDEAVTFEYKLFLEMDS